VGVAVCDTVAVADPVTVGDDVIVAVAVCVAVNVREAVGVGVDILVWVAVEICVVAVGVNVSFGVLVTVAVRDVIVGGGAVVTVAVCTAVKLNVAVERGLTVGVRVNGEYTTGFVGLFVGRTVLVMDGTITGVVEAAPMRVCVGIDVRVIRERPGVRKSWIQLGCVRIEASMGSISPLGRRVRKALFGSR
jgi:hypothetical protein